MTNLNSFNNMWKTLLIVTALLSLPLMTSAQRQAGDVGIGAQLGQPTGLTVKVYGQKSSIDFLAAWDLDDFFFLNIHRVADKPLNDAHTSHFFYGPGAFIGIRDRSPLEDDVALGVSGTFGLDFLIDKIEIFIQATPRLELIEQTDFDMGGGAGFRVYF